MTMKQIVLRLSKSTLLLYISLQLLSAQQLPLLKVGLREGLPQSSVFRISQDKIGYVWLATQGGLCRYDGLNFKNYSQYDGIGSNFIKDLAFDIDGKLWLATLDNGVVGFDGNHFTQINSDAGLK